MRAVIERIAHTNSSVLITGATGTGKEIVARLIHAQSNRAQEPFVDVNCSAIPEALFETEFFGHERGTFTGAHEMRRGLFEQCAGGTLFLDEVDALPLTAQAKLLRVLQERTLRRVGGRENIRTDVRIISSTNRNLQAAIAAGAFRPDLFFRLRVVPIYVPPLAERREDVPLLITHFLGRHAKRTGEKLRSFTPKAVRVMQDHDWAGNVRELENAIEFAVALGMGEQLDVNDLPPNLLPGFEFETAPLIAGSDPSNILRSSLAKRLPLAEVERCYIVAMYELHDKHSINTAAALGIDRRTLYRKLKEYGVG
ncbi:MAG: sigma-54 dependent transcriptional regulator [Pyrinomonadaceae bacterium MAG19_C2-C3]|nr:sigma-54 dependent transcriptional regulator [Pyrinomonadaceae bacterium MAG19_C2-C3]